MQDNSSIVPKSFQCSYIHVSGRRCGSSSLRDEQFCYYHRATCPPGAPSQTSSSPEVGFDHAQPGFRLQFIEDRASLQIALNQVLQRIAAGVINRKVAGLLLHGLRLVSSNLRYADQALSLAPESNCVEDVVYDPEYGHLAPIAELPKLRSLPSAHPKDHPSDAVASFLKTVALEKEQYEKEQRNPTRRPDDDEDAPCAVPVRKPS